jgi:dipeptidyl aminopeptidase/acylaminoacyl peptidase
VKQSFWQKHKQKILTLSLIFFSISVGFVIGNFFPITNETPLLSPFVEKGLVKKDLPLLQYTIPNLKSRRYAPSNIVIEKIIKEETDFISFLFSYTSNQKKITGQLNLPKTAINNPKEPTPIILLIRGYVPQEIYGTGMGTKNAASVFAQNGYITIAPDFLGFGESDSDLENSWESRFVKPIQIIELISTIRSQITLEYKSVETNKMVTINPEKLGIWAHSNGGQIALTSLEITGQSIPTTLWAPVTVPFPYSVLFYTDEMDDEGRATRTWLADFEKNYDPREFSLTQYLDSLAGPIQLHHGTADDAALKTWSDEFIEKIEAINKVKESKEQEVIDITYEVYPGADHNMVPNWNEVIQKDLKFFSTEFKKIDL